MPFYPNTATKPTWALLSCSFAFHATALFTGILCPAFFERHAREHAAHFGAGQTDTYNAPVTLWAWLSQTLSGSKSCLAATARVLVLCCSLGRPLPSANPGAYCKARAKLPLDLLQALTRDIGAQVEAKAPDAWRWKGRRVKLVDGTIVLAPDSAANLQEFPQQRSQKKGTSYTCLRLVVLLALASACVLDAALGPYKGKGTGEISLLHSLRAGIDAGDILLGDRYYGSYALLALLRQAGADGGFRLPVGRQKEFGQGQPLGPDDYLHTWTKPEQRPQWLDKDTWAALPKTLAVRLVHFRVRRPGWRTRAIYLVSTLTDARAYTAEDLAELYGQRWHCELDLRSIKQGLGLKRLSCQTPAMLRKEVWVHLLGYNLTRCVLAQAALEKGVKARELSFQGGVQTLDAFRWLLSGGGAADGETPALAAQAVSAALGVHRVGHRPGRSEPREIKHRQRKYPELKKPRQARRQELPEPPAEEDQGSRKRPKGSGKDRPSGR